MLHAVAEQVAVGEQRQRIVEGELAQLLLERLALADVAKVERQALHGRIVASGCCRRSRARSARCRARCAAPPGRPCRPGVAATSARNSSQALAVLAAPELGQVLAGDVLGPQAERALGGGRDEPQHAVGGDDHDDVGGVARSARRSAPRPCAPRAARGSAHPRAAPRAWRTITQQRQGEHDHGHQRSPGRRCRRGVKYTSTRKAASIAA